MNNVYEHNYVVYYVFQNQVKSWTCQGNQKKDARIAFCQEFTDNAKILEIVHEDEEINVHDIAMLEGVLSEISFQNTCLDFKWQFEITPNNDPNNPGWFVNVAFQRPDTHTGEIGTGRGRKEFIAKGAYQSGIVKTGWLLVELVVRHELMEGFHWRGKRVFNPHNSVHSLASIQ